MKLDIITFDESHLDAVCEIERASFSDPWSDLAFRESAKALFTEIFVALDDSGAICGYIAVNVIAPECEILNLAVSSERRRLGIAGKLIEFVFDRAREKGCHTVMLDVRESNTPAIEFYKKHGFYEVGIRKGFYSSPKENALLMDRKL